jgi:hypothetical protein
VKRIEVKGKLIETPWLRSDEAAAYVGLSRSAFDLRAKRLPHTGVRVRLYDSRILDAWLSGMLPDIPFDEPEEAPPVRARRKRYEKKEPPGVYHPITGKFYPTKLPGR